VKIRSLKNAFIQLIIICSFYSSNLYAQQKAIIERVIPKTSPYNTMKASSAAKLIIGGITDKEDISVTINGEDFTRFTFDSETGAMRMQIALKEELNIIQVSADNGYGEVLEEFKINYESPVSALKPKIVFTKPNTSGSTVNQRSYEVEALVQMSSKEDIIVQINQTIIDSFTYDALNEVIKFKADLEPQENYINISASNSSGQTQKMLKIIYRK